MTGLQIARKMKPDGVRIKLGVRNEYDPETRTVRLSLQTALDRTMEALANAAHECGHAVQHVRGHWRWRLWRALSWTALNLLTFAAAVLAVALDWHTWSVSIGASSLLIARVLVVLAIEREASEIAWLWLNLNGFDEPGMSEYLEKLRRSYRWSTIGL